MPGERGMTNFAELCGATNELCDSVEVLLLERQALRDQLEEFREQHTKIWTAAHDKGLPVLGETGWRDSEYREWEQRLERTVECPDCGFSFGRGHEDEGGGYSCPSCSEIALREALSAIEASSREFTAPNWYAAQTAIGDLARASLRDKV